MMHKFAARSLILFTLSILPLCAADVLYWSGNGTSLGGVGTWNTTTARFGALNSGPFSRYWTNANVDSLILDGTAGTITVGANVTVNQITNNVAGFTFAGSSKITFSGTSAGVDNSTGTKVSLPLIGGTTFTKTGSGRVELSINYNTVSRYIIQGGVLTTANTNRWGSASGVTNFLVLDGGAGWGIDTTDQELSPARGIYLNSGGGSLGSYNAGLTLTVNGRITGPGNLTFPAPVYSSDATWVLGNKTNDWKGNTYVKGGTLTLGASEVLPDATYLQLTTGGSLDLNGFDETVGKVYVYSSTATIAGSTNTLTATNFDLRASSTISAKLGGNATATKTTTGMVTLTGANTFNAGLTLSAGVLRVGNNAALGTGKLTLVGGTLQANSGTARALSVPVDVNGNVTLGSSTNLGSLTFQTGAWTITNASRTLTVDTITNTIKSAIGEDGNARGLTKAGTGKLILSGENTFTGGILLSEGILEGTTSGLKVDIIDATSLIFNQTTNGTYAGVISDVGALTKNGSGTVTLSTANTYSGPTTNNAGSLLVNASLSSPTVIVNGGTLGGTGPFQGAVTVNTGGSIGAGSSAGLMTLGNGMDLSPGGTNVWELAAPKDDIDGIAGSDFDQLSLTGGELNLSGNSRLLLKFIGTASAPFSTNTFWQASHAWTIVKLTAPGANTAASPFVSIANSNYNAGFFSNYVDTAGNIVLTYTTHPPSAPIITAQPQSRTNNQGTTATFTVGAFGTDPLAYQWYFQNTSTPVVGATTATLTKTSVQPADEGSYFVVVTNLYSPPATSSMATLTVIVPPAITFPPQNASATVGGSATFNVTATGTLPLAYQWYFNGTTNPISGATASTYTLNNVQNTNAGSYLVIVTNAAGKATNSPAAVLTVTTGICSQTNRILSAVNNVDAGTITLNFIGTPQAEYYVVTHTNVEAALATWTPVVGSTNTAPSPSGLWSMSITHTEARRFYRAKAINACP
jgi:autotransporter-associated beta strand protein